MSEIRNLSVVELKHRLSDEEESLANLRFQLSTSQLESPIKVRIVRRDIARIKTLIRQKESAVPSVSTPKAAPKATTEVKKS
ncbi:MAG: ribosomal protein [Bacteroidetes bacterium]|nr:ribosomal protein [Bacteroidota bacterium]